MSPTHDFKNIGEVLDFELLKGIITAIDSATDTCTVTVAGSSMSALLFYHCKPDSIARENGAIEGAANGFAVSDEVMVLINSSKNIIKVIGHIDGVRSCGGFAVFKFSLTYIYGVDTQAIEDRWNSAFVWDINKKEAMMWENGTIVNSTDTDFKAWYDNKTFIGETFLDSARKDTFPYGVEPTLIDTPTVLYHANTNSVLELFPRSWRSGVVLEESAVEIIGIRTEKDSSDVTITEYSCYLIDNMFYADMPLGFEGGPPKYQYGGPHVYQTSNISWTIYGYLGINAEPLYEGKNSIYQEWGPQHESGPLFGCAYAHQTQTEWIPQYYPTIHRLSEWSDSYWEIRRKNWFSDCTIGQYTGTNIVVVSAIQYIAFSEDSKRYDGLHFYDTVKYAPVSGRIIKVQAQAIPTSVNWFTEERTTELETTIIFAINKVYELNNFGQDEIRIMGIQLELL